MEGWRKGGERWRVLWRRGVEEGRGVGYFRGLEGRRGEKDGTVEGWREGGERERILWRRGV